MIGRFLRRFSANWWRGRLKMAVLDGVTRSAVDYIPTLPDGKTTRDTDGSNPPMTVRLTPVSSIYPQEDHLLQEGQNVQGHSLSHHVFSFSRSIRHCYLVTTSHFTVHQLDQPTSRGAYSVAILGDRLTRHALWHILQEPQQDLNP
jgi:hypothetical protein